jgi:hypothetical protein
LDPSSLRGRKAATKKNHEGREGIDAQVLASFAPLRELFVSREGAKPAKQQRELLVFYARAGLIADFMVLIILSEKQVSTGLYYGRTNCQSVRPADEQVALRLTGRIGNPPYRLIAEHRYIM